MKRKHNSASANTEDDGSEGELPARVRSSDEPLPKKAKWTNKQRVLVFASRGISYRDRHLMEDIRTLMPHSRPDSKMERKDNLFVVNEICEMKNCNKCILFEGRMKRDLYMWISNVPNGPSAKFLVENVYTMAELKLTGNCLKGSRPLLSFDEHFNKHPQYSLLKELFVQIFGTPYYHPKSQPFTDHVMTFTILDNRIWFRNYQILSEDGALAEIGPRFVLNPIKIFSSSFGGETLWENPMYISPALFRRQVKKAAAGKYEHRLEKKLAYEESKPEFSYKLNPYDEIYTEDTLQAAEKIASIKPEDSEVNKTSKIDKKLIKLHKLKQKRRKVMANSNSKPNKKFLKKQKFRKNKTKNKQQIKK